MGAHSAYLSHTNASSTSALSVVHSLIFQLAFDDENLQNVLYGLSRKNLKNNLSVAFEIFTTLLAYAGTVYIIIDGVDEISDRERFILLKHLLDVLKGCDTAKICISSRPEDDLKRVLGDQASSIRVDGQNSGSIRRFVL